MPGTPSRHAIGLIQGGTQSGEQIHRLVGGRTGSEQTGSERRKAGEGARPLSHVIIIVASHRQLEHKSYLPVVLTSRREAGEDVYSVQWARGAREETGEAAEGAARYARSPPIKPQILNPEL